MLHGVALLLSFLASTADQSDMTRALEQLQSESPQKAAEIVLD